MAQDFDKIFKENIEEIILPLAKKILDIHPYKLEEIPDDLQITFERKPDFLKKVISKKNSPEYILHLEFQVKKEPDMDSRMLLYWAMLYNRYKLPSQQYVIYIGRQKAKKPLRISFKSIEYTCQFVNMLDIDYNIFLNSDKPEEIMMGILADYGGDAPVKVIENILKGIKSSPVATIRREKCFVQLEVLSKLRNLQAEVIDKIIDMALTYDLKTDLRYIQYRKEGEKEQREAVKAVKEAAKEAVKEAKEAGKEATKEAVKEAKEAAKEAAKVAAKVAAKAAAKVATKEGEKKGIDEILINFIKNSSLSIEEIAKSANVPVAHVKKLAEKVKRK